MTVEIGGEVPRGYAIGDVISAAGHLPSAASLGVGEFTGVGVRGALILLGARRLARGEI